ncbi:hypothetical protein [Pseudoalteromonas maricaloris]|uniref:hypothetical protein n=1 Tax=Pseudoalteromonas maricaloris TaxID=184924 RepID=UPI00029B2864|nr:hypothetical protein [Pseudoalteromonas flavipulchra]
MKTFSFLDCESQDLIRVNGQIVRIKADDHHHAFDLFIDTIADNSENWTNTGTKAWCWEDME